jgi:galactokinase
VVAGFLRRGITVPGFDALVASTVPLGSGLSSSAALEVSTATLLEALNGPTLRPLEKAQLCQKAEHEFARVPCGIMDQSISVMGQADHAMLMDCRTLERRMVPLADPGVTVLIANTNVKHELTGGEYAQRRQECEEGARTLGVKALRDASALELDHAKGQLGNEVYRRARHVVTEIDRTLRAADAAGRGDWDGFGRLMFESHASLRDDFEVSVRELDTLVELARERSGGGGVYGARMTGGGFGGCTVTLVTADAADDVTRHLVEGYRRATGIDATVFATRAAEGARPLRVPA